MRKIIVAIDGFSSCGKSTMAKGLANEVGYRYIDTGAMYRAVTLYVIRKGYVVDGEIDLDSLGKEMGQIEISFEHNPVKRCTETYLNGENVEKEIRQMAVANLVSPVAAVPFVREALVCRQRQMGLEKGIVMDGRDIGTVVFPDAELKIFLTASPEIRARRRLQEMISKGEEATFEEVLENVRNRDHIDMTREVGPLRKADDAIELDNSDMTLERQKAWLLEQFLHAVNQ